MTGVLGEYLGLPCHHWNEELPLIRAVLEDARPVLVVETGTMHGGFAAFLHDTVRQWGGRVLTVDIVIYPGVGEILRRRMGLTMLVGDVTDPWTCGILSNLLLHPASEPSMLYCDGPAGRPELEILGAFAQVVGVHDYGTDVDPERAEAWAARHHAYPFHERAFRSLQDEKSYFVSRFWRR